MPNANMIYGILGTVLVVLVALWIFRLVKKEIPQA